MQTNALPKMEISAPQTGCCPRFDPTGWEGRHLHFQNKLFVCATTRSLLHVPINMGRVFTRVQGHIEDSGAQDPDGTLVLSRDLSASEGEHLFAVTTTVPEEEMTTLSGDLITRVFEGPYRKSPDWVHEMGIAAQVMGHEVGRIFMFYTTCPRCARAYGKNYVVGVAEIDMDPEKRGRMKDEGS
ncbi:hydrolase [Roseobacter weihaiensis]|uniref:hydrolase n=1 Tax=Roseobacter weihaiensis TaxID=2763262 RepID=UPI001D0AD4AE|nr:hydrolase [Roseobacter sp. H9]